MATIAPVKKRSIYEYPEHLNPFREEDSQSKLKSWARRSFRSNSFSVPPVLKDFRNTWSFKSFTKKGRRELHSSQVVISKTEQTTPITLRRKPNGITPSSTTAIDEKGGEFNRSYGGPLSKYHTYERGSLQVEKNPYNPAYNRPSKSVQPQNESNISTNGTMNSEFGDSMQSLQSNSTIGDTRNTSIRASARKKRKAPLPPPRENSSITTTITTTTEIPPAEVKKEAVNGKEEVDGDDSFLNIELKIIEEDDVIVKESNVPKKETEIPEENIELEEVKKSKESSNEYEDDIDLSEFISRKDSLRKSIGDMKYVMKKLQLDESKTQDKNLFPKVNIVSYKRRQSVDINENNEIESNGETHSPDGDIESAKCKLIDRPSEKYKISDSDTIQIRQNGNRKNSNDSNGRVSAMRLIFDSPSPDEKIPPNSINFPNPLPKPRRTKLLKSNSSDESVMSEPTPSPTNLRENLI